MVKRASKSDTVKRAIKALAFNTDVSQITTPIASSTRNDIRRILSIRSELMMLPDKGKNLRNYIS